MMRCCTSRLSPSSAWATVLDAGVAVDMAGGGRGGTGPLRAERFAFGRRLQLARGRSGVLRSRGRSVIFGWPSDRCRGSTGCVPDHRSGGRFGTRVTGSPFVTCQRGARYGTLGAERGLQPAREALPKGRSGGRVCMASQQAGRLSHAVAFGGPQARVLGRAGGGLGDRPSPRGSASGSGGSAGDGSGSPMMIRQHGSQYIQARTAGLCPHRMHGLVIIRRPAWRLGPVGAGRRSDTPRRTEPASRRRPSTSDTATPGRRSPPPRGPRLTGRATW